MHTNSLFQCPYCQISPLRSKIPARQRIVFAGGEFQYQCNVCKSFHLFSENIFYNINDHFLPSSQENKLNKYVGTYNVVDDKFVDIDGQLIDRSTTANLLINAIHGLNGPIDFNVITVDNLQYKKSLFTHKVFIASALHAHYQESLRGFVRMYEHVHYGNGKDTYNILIAPKSIENLCLKQKEKIDGIDGIIFVDFKKQYLWAYRAGTTENYSALDIVLTRFFDKITEEGTVISKRSGPIKEDPSALQKLLDPTGVVRGIGCVHKDQKFVVIQTRSNGSQDRSLLCHAKEINKLAEIIYSYDLDPLVVTFSGELNETEREAIHCKVFLDLRLEEQSFLYKNHCLGMIGPNGSASNFPALWGKPILAFAKSYPYPMDFYSFGRMMYYNPSEPIFGGEVRKAENIKEISIDQQLIDISHYENDIRKWLETYCFKHVIS